MLGAVALATGAPAAAARTGSLEISALRAHLFYHGTGTVSDDLLARKKVVLWNTPIGAGDAGAPSNATFVVVELQGPAREYVQGHIGLTVTTGNRTLLKRTQDLGVLNGDGRTYAGFWIYNTGCEPLQLLAEVSAPSGGAPRRATVPFECGE